MPPNAPQVSFRDGMLTVVANNSTLGDILNAVRSKTGASVDYPAGVTQERVMASVGPAPAPQVLAALLNGSHFDYILVGADGHPDVLQKAIITAKEGAGGPASAGGVPVAGGAAPRGVPPPRPSDDDMENAPPDDAEQQPEEQAPAQQAPPQPPPNPNTIPFQGPKSPEMLLQELQKIQQQQQQQQQPPQEQPQPQ